MGCMCSLHIVANGRVNRGERIRNGWLHNSALQSQTWNPFAQLLLLEFHPESKPGISTCWLNTNHRVGISQYNQGAGLPNTIFCETKPMNKNLFQQVQIPSWCIVLVLLSATVLFGTRLSSLGFNSMPSQKPGEKELAKWEGQQPSTPEPVQGDSQPSARILGSRQKFDTSGLYMIADNARWKPNSTLEEIGDLWGSSLNRTLQKLEAAKGATRNPADILSWFATKAVCHMSAGQPDKAYAELKSARAFVERNEELKWNTLATLMYFQGVAAFRKGENDNCVLCRGETSCIVPISPAAVHKNTEGSRLAIQHFTEYLAAFPDDLEVQWLLNLAHMTLGEYPDKVDPRYRLDFTRFFRSDESIGRFRDIGHLVGLNRFNLAGPAIMDDLDNDGLFDLAVTSFDPQQQPGLYRNLGNGRFEECAASAGISNQLGGLNCVQTDYNNDGLIDLFITRGAWLMDPMRPSLLRNDGEFRFTDVTDEAGLLDPNNSISSQWGDFDNDGWLDLFMCSERTSNRLYKNLGNGKFREIAAEAGLATNGRDVAKGCAWIDYDNDDYLDLFVTNLGGTAQLYHNNRDSTFTNVTVAMGIFGPQVGFSCWSWDYDNDGWQDIFATCYVRGMDEVVRGMQGQPHSSPSSKLYRNDQGKRFIDVTQESGVDMVFLTMGSNFADFDNDGFLDFYLGTGEPNFATLIPNRMFHNNAGKRFTEITGSAGVGHLQKGHGVACGDWDRDGNVDMFVDLGGAVLGDKYHNALFQNPGNDNAWLCVKLVGKQTNRAALGVRIKVVTKSAAPQTIHRHVTAGSSFGGNPFEQHIGLGAASGVESLEIHWPASGTTQTFHDLQVNQVLEITEFSEAPTRLDRPQIVLPNAGTDTQASK